MAPSSIAAASDTQKPIFIIGMPASGKSAVGRKLSQLVERQFYDSDAEIENAAGADVAWIFELEGEAGFRVRESKILESLAQHHNSVIATGGGAILSAANRALMRNSGVVVYLEVPLPTLLQRVQQDNKNGRRPLLAEQPETKIKELFEQRAPLYLETAHHTIGTYPLQSSTKTAQIVAQSLGFSIHSSHANKR